MGFGFTSDDSRWIHFWQENALQDLIHLWIRLCNIDEHFINMKNNICIQSVVKKPERECESKCEFYFWGNCFLKIIEIIGVPCNTAPRRVVRRFEHMYNCGGRLGQVTHKIFGCLSVICVNKVTVGVTRGIQGAVWPVSTKLRWRSDIRQRPW